MIPLKDIKIISARKQNGSKIVPADGDQSKPRRNFKRIISDCKYPTSLHQFSKFRYDQRAILVLGSHDYVKSNVTILNHKIDIEPRKSVISRDVDRALIEKGPNKTQTANKLYLS